MATANFFDLLILPIFECTAGIFATFAIIKAVGAVIGYLLEPRRVPDVGAFEPRANRPAAYRTFSPRTHRAHSRSAGFDR